MKTSYKRLSILGAFAILLFILIANGFITRHQLAVQTESQTWVARSRRVLLELNRTESLLKDAETGQRGFLYTGEPKYLAPYNAAIAQIGQHLDRLTRLTADNPTQQAQISILRDLTNKKLAELSITIALYQSGKPDEARAHVLSDTGLINMDKIRDVVALMESEESSLASLRADAYRRSISRTVASIYVTSLVACLSLILIAYYIFRGIAMREKHAQELRAREEWFRVTLTSIGDAVVATDKEGKVTFINPKAQSLIGIDEESAVGKNILEIFPIYNEYTHQLAENPVSKVMSQGHVVGLANHTVLENTNGTLTPIEDSAAPIRGDQGELLGVVLVFHDVTDVRKSQEVLRKTEKLAAAARLSATVAHEINNPLEAVVNLVWIAKSTPGTPASVVENLTLAEQELERVAHITRQTLGFYRDSSQSDEIEIPPLIDSVLRLYSNKLQSKNISVHLDFADCPPVRGMAGEIQQVVSNLIANAADAVDLDGSIRISLRCNRGADSETVQISIEDDGPGIPAEHVDRIFEPFFTTKRDVGTGLGLWLSKEIVERHGGTIHVNPREPSGSGAAFNIILPFQQEVSRVPTETHRN